jgi:hypothetical protein
MRTINIIGAGSGCPHWASYRPRSASNALTDVSYAPREFEIAQGLKPFPKYVQLRYSLNPSKRRTSEFEGRTFALH